MIGIIVGKKIRGYVDKKTNEPKMSRILYVLWDKPKNPVDGESGNKVSEEYISFEIPSGVDIGTKCDFEYDIQNTKNGAMARLVDIVPLEQLCIKFEPVK